MKRAERLRLAALCAAAFALWAADRALAFWRPHGDIVYYLNPAFHFARGHGISTDILYPTQIAALEGAISFPAPFLWHGPLAPAALGLAGKLTGFADWGPSVYALAFLFLVGLASYRLGRELGGEAAGLLAAALLWSSHLIVDYWTSSLTDPLFAFFITTAWLFLWSSRGREKVESRLLAAGFCLGLASGTRLAGQTYWPGFFLAAAWLHGWSRRAPLYLVGGLALGLIPLVGFNLSAGAPPLLSPGSYLLLMSTKFPGAASFTSYLGLSTPAAFLQYPGEILRKALTGPLYGVSNLVTQNEAPYLSVAMLLGLLMRQSGPAETFRRLALWIATPVFLANLVLAAGTARYLQPLWPLACVFAAFALLRFVDANLSALRRRPLLGLAVFAFVFLSPFALALKRHAQSRGEEIELYEEMRELGDFVADRVPEGGVVYSDDPPNVVWHSGRPGVHLGFTLADFEKSAARVKPAAILLSSLRIQSSDYAEEFRQAFRENKEVAGFIPCGRFRDERITALLLRHPADCAAARDDDDEDDDEDDE